MARVRRGEAWLLVAASAVLVAAVVSVPLLHDGGARGTAGSVPPLPRTTGPTPAATPAPTASGTPAPSAAAAPPVSGVRITTYSRGSHQLVVRVRVGPAAAAALVQVAGEAFPLELVDGEAAGTLALSCDGTVPELLLVVTTAAGAEVVTSLGRPAAAVAAACGSPLPVGAVPTGTSRGS